MSIIANKGICDGYVKKNNNTAKNNLKREFNASKPNKKWVTDVTEFKYGKHNENVRN